MKTFARLVLAFMGAVVIVAACGAGFLMLLCAKFGDDWPQPDEEYLI